MKAGQSHFAEEDKGILRVRHVFDPQFCLHIVLWSDWIAFSLKVNFSRVVSEPTSLQ